MADAPSGVPPGCVLMQIKMHMCPTTLNSTKELFCNYCSVSVEYGSTKRSGISNPGACMLQYLHTHTELFGPSTVNALDVYQLCLLLSSS
jgi:hypothetical protein